MAGQPMRYDAHIIKARELVNAGAIGTPTRFYTPRLYAPGVAAQSDPLVLKSGPERRYHD